MRTEDVPHSRFRQPFREVRKAVFTVRRTGLLSPFGAENARGQEGLS